MEVVFELCDWVRVMHRGAILAEGSPAEIRDDPKVREVYLGETLQPIDHPFGTRVLPMS
jgi:branched-chain amino acid transport system ATP-binding protein